jgi:hypothetical protein
MPPHSRGKLHTCEGREIDRYYQLVVPRLVRYRGAGDDGNTAGVRMIDDHVKAAPIIAVLGAWLGISPRKKLDDPRGAHGCH